MNGAAGGPTTSRMPGGVGIRSPIRTRLRPPTVTPLEAGEPIMSGYGKPHTELIIRHMDPDIASGMPLAVITGGKIPTMIPMSGGPEAPGVIMTCAPMLTGDPGMAFLYGPNEVIPFTCTVAA